MSTHQSLIDHIQPVICLDGMRCGKFGNYAQSILFINLLAIPTNSGLYLRYAKIIHIQEMNNQPNHHPLGPIQFADNGSQESIQAITAANGGKRAIEGTINSVW